MRQAIHVTFTATFSFRLVLKTILTSPALASTTASNQSPASNRRLSLFLPGIRILHFSASHFFTLNQATFNRQNDRLLVGLQIAPLVQWLIGYSDLLHSSSCRLCSACDFGADDVLLTAPFTRLVPSNAPRPYVILMWRLPPCTGEANPFGGEILTEHIYLAVFRNYGLYGCHCIHMLWSCLWNCQVRCRHLSYGCSETRPHC